MAFSYKEIVQKLPEGFITKIYKTFPQPTAEKIIRGFGQERLTTIRVNTIKSDVRYVLRELWDENIKVDRVLWYNDALVIKTKKEKDIEALELYKNGSIYLQSLSSMIPPLALNPKPFELVLDMAAAPGSKTTQMAAMMQNNGAILSNDVDKIRLERLKYNIDTQGATIVKTTCQNGTKFGNTHPETFDKILLDAPCSGEGLFLAKDPQTYRHWSERTVNKSSALQRKLMISAIKALKPGGILVYSTCTISPEENEMVINETLQKFPGLISVENIPLKIPHSTGGIIKFKETALDNRIKKAKRILPSETMEGFFICKLKKNDF